MVDGRHSLDDMGRGSWLASRRRERHAIGSAGDGGGDGATLTKSLSDRRGDEAACDHAKHGGVWPVGATKDRGIEEIVVASVGLDDVDGGAEGVGEAGVTVGRGGTGWISRGAFAGPNDDGGTGERQWAGDGVGIGDAADAGRWRVDRVDQRQATRRLDVGQQHPPAELAATGVGGDDRDGVGDRDPGGRSGDVVTKPGSDVGEDGRHERCLI